MCKCTPAGHEVHPQAERESIFRTVYAWWLRFGGIFRRQWLKKVVNFFAKNAHPQTKSWLRLWPQACKLIRWTMSGQQADTIELGLRELHFESKNCTALFLHNFVKQAQPSDRLFIVAGCDTNDVGRCNAYFNYKDKSDKSSNVNVEYEACSSEQTRRYYTLWFLYIFIHSPTGSTK